MSIKNTILSEKDATLMEKVMGKYGRIVTIRELMGIFQEEYSRASAHNRISQLAQAGWFRRMKRGQYLVIDSLSARSSIDVSMLSIANALMADSYVSLSHALNYYQLFDQYSGTIVSITRTASKKYTFDNLTFKYAKVKKNIFFGYTEKIISGKRVRLAEVEKVLIDYLYLDKSFGSASVVFEIIKNHHEELDLMKLQRYAVRCGITTSRKIGFMLDEAHRDSTKLYRSIGANRGVSRLTTDSKVLNAKWRLYYDDRIIG